MVYDRPAERRLRPFHSAGHETPSSRASRRTVDSDIPTTVEGSPSTDSMNGPPRLSIVKAPATCSGSPDATYASISSSLIVGGEPHGCLGDVVRLARRRARRDAEDAVARVQHPGPPAHVPPPGGRRLGRVRLAVDRPVELEHRVAADDDAVETRVIGADPGGNVRGLAAGEHEHVLGGREGATRLGLDAGDDRVLVDVRGEGQGLDARLPQQHEAGGRRRGEADLHPLTLAVECSET